MSKLGYILSFVAVDKCDQILYILFIFERNWDIMVKGINGLFFAQGRVFD